MKKLDIDEVRAFIEAQSPETKIYIGGDSERFLIGNDWYADYTLAVVVHIDGKHGAKVFGEVQRERDWDQKKSRPRMRLMNEVYKIAELYQKLHDVLGGSLRSVCSMSGSGSSSILVSISVVQVVRVVA